MSLLPSEPDTSAAEENDPRVIGVDSEEADDVLSALTAETGRELLSALHDEPAPPAELADRVDTSLQNAQYHLNKLESAGAIEVIDTVYSEKGREMDVYAPADRPLVIFAGDEDQSSGLRAALSRLLSSVAVLALASVAVQQVFGGGVGGLFPSAGSGGAGGGGDAGADGAESRSAATETATPTPEEQAGVLDAEATQTATPEPEMTEAATRTAAETAASGGGVAGAALQLPPGLLFFLGGTTALLVVAGVWYLSDVAGS